MAWTAPMTAVAGAPFTAAQFNQTVRDNLNETAPAKATQSGSYFVGNGVNSIVERTIAMDEINFPEESTSSTAYTDLSTTGPSVTLETGAFVLVAFSCRTRHGTSNSTTWTAVEISGATTHAADNDESIQIDVGNPANKESGSRVLGFAVTPGVNTFKLKYRVGVGTGYWARRQITVMPF